MKLSAAYLTVALKLQEAEAELSTDDVAARLRDAIADKYRGTGQWSYYCTYFGNAESGDVIFSCDSDTMRAPYQITTEDGQAAKCFIDFDQAEDVVPRTVYEPEVDESEHYASMEESLKAEGVYKSLPIYERFISKGERKAASADDFAGKGRSFPILKPADVMAAVHSMGRAGSANSDSATLKSRIIAIAKRKGWEKYLPKAWQSSKTKESSAAAAGSLILSESAATIEPIVLREARADYEIKLIAPGKGSSAFYPAEVLKRDGPKVFKAGTHVYLNHPTAAEESARPEGDVANLAGVLTTDASYQEAHGKGEGLYARMKVFADHATMVEEKAAHVGMSIRASGIAESGKVRDGVPVLKELISAESVDVVTKAGAGGMILTEAARPQSQEVSMTEAEQKALIESAVKAALTESTKQSAQVIAALEARAIRGDAREEATRLLESVTLPPASKARVIEGCLRDIPVTDGKLDGEKFKVLVESAAKAEGQYLTSILGDGARPFAMGAPAPVQIDPKEAEAQRLRAEQEAKGHVAIFESLGMPKDAAALAAKGRAA